MNDTKPLTRGQRKRRLVLERIKRKQDLTTYILKQKQLAKIKNNKCYNLNKLKQEILESTKNEEQLKLTKKKLTTKKMQTIREKSLNYMKEILQHPDFNELEQMKSKLLDNMEFDIQNKYKNETESNNESNIKYKLKTDPKSKRLLKVNKSIKK